MMMRMMMMMISIKHSVGWSADMSCSNLLAYKSRHVTVLLHLVHTYAKMLWSKTTYPPYLFHEHTSIPTLNRSYISFSRPHSSCHLSAASHNWSSMIVSAGNPTKTGNATCASGLASEAFPLTPMLLAFSRIFFCLHRISRSIYNDPHQWPHHQLSHLLGLDTGCWVCRSEVSESCNYAEALDENSDRNWQNPMKHLNVLYWLRFRSWQHRSSHPPFRTPWVETT